MRILMKWTDCFRFLIFDTDLFDGYLRLIMVRGWIGIGIVAVGSHGLLIFEDAWRSCWEP